MNIQVPVKHGISKDKLASAITRHHGYLKAIADSLDSSVAVIMELIPYYGLSAFTKNVWDNRPQSRKAVHAEYDAWHPGGGRPSGHKVIPLRDMRYKLGRQDSK